MLQHGAYNLLIDSCYERERFPTMGEALTWAWAETAEEAEAVEFVLNRFFTLQEGRYVQKRIEEEIEHYKHKALQNKRIAVERGRKMRRAKK